MLNYFMLIIYYSIILIYLSLSLLGEIRLFSLQAYLPLIPYQRSLIFIQAYAAASLLHE